MVERAAIILAAGQGTRMRSPLPKVLHRVGGRTMLDHAVDSAIELGCTRVVVVAGSHSPSVIAAAAARVGRENVAIQDPPKGTGHAVQAARAALAGFDGDVVVTYADTPLLDAKGVEPVFACLRGGADLAVLGFEAADPKAYGRLIMDHSGLLRIVEAADADGPALQIKKCNSGVMAASASLMFDLLSELTNANAKGEYYLTDIVAIARQRGLAVKATFTDETRVLGVNSQAELSVAEQVFQRARRLRAFADGVAMAAPDSVFFAWDTQIAAGAMIEPYVVFGPGVTVETGAVIRAFSHLEGATVREGAEVGPYARLRPGADIGAGARIGNFVEVKNVTLGKGAKANHLSYLGDGAVGAGANIGAGVIFCNYDGFDKQQTVIGAGAFIGSDTSLVAPVTVGDGAYVGSGSVIVSDVGADALAVARGRQVEKPGWAAAFRKAKQEARTTK
jgi:bifunctional UDP-N-acetylglucosamine pyrophosphorylase / glucosamine-1-phosphate N-acetyltransferase